MGERPYIRRAEFTIWDHPLVGATLDETASTKIIGDGSRDTLRIRFSIQRSILGVPVCSDISIYNLSKDTQKLLREPLHTCRLMVGWQNNELYEIFRGQIMASVTDKQNTDYITTAKALAVGGDMTYSVMNNSYAEGTPIQHVLQEVVKTLPGVSWDARRVSIPDYKVGFKGLVLAGRAKDMLDKLALQYGFSWSIHFGTFQAIIDGESGFTTTFPLLSSDSTLKKILPILVGPTQIQSGVSIRAILQPFVWPGDRVMVDSSVNDYLNAGYNKDGTYTCHIINYDGDTGGNEWDMEIQSFRNFGNG